MMGHYHSHHNHNYNTNKGFAYHPSHFYAAAAASALPQGTRLYTSTGMPPGPPSYAPPTYTQVAQQQTQGGYNNNTNSHHHQNHHPLQLSSQAFPPLHVTTSTFTFPPTFASVQPPPQQHSSVPLRVAHLRPTPAGHHSHHHAPSTSTTLGALINHIHQQQHQQAGLNSGAGASHLQALHRHQQQQQHNLQQQHKQLQQQQVGTAWLQQLAAHNVIQSSQQPTTYVQVYPVEQARQVSFSKRTHNNTYGLNMNAFILKAEGADVIDGGEAKAKEPKEDTKIEDEEPKAKEEAKIENEESQAKEETKTGNEEEVDGKKPQSSSGSGSGSPVKDKDDKVEPPTIKGYKGEDYYVDERNNTWHFRPVTINAPVKFIPGAYSPMPLISVCRKRDRRRWSHQLQHMHQMAASGNKMGRFWGTAPAFQPAPPEECFLDPPPPIPEDVTGIREVWKHNLSTEFQKIRELVKSNFCYIAMDTEFPGTVARPVGEFKTSSEYQYELIRVNCDLLKLIQLGITFLDKDGNFPDGITTWQFNFKFNLKEDMYAEDSIKMLTKCGIQFAKHESDGIDPQDFAYYMISSGMILDESVTWISFHSGYDLGHLYRIMTGKNLPRKEEEFFAELKLYFPKIFDVKCLMTACKAIKGGLQECAEILDVERVGYQHQAGSDSYVTGLAFFRIQEVFYDDTDPVAFNGHVFGLDCNYSKV